MKSVPARALASLALALPAAMALTAGNPSDETIAGVMQRHVQPGEPGSSVGVVQDGALDSLHPRGRGAFTRVLRTYVREKQLLGLEEAIRKMTGLAAANVGIADRGVIRPGAFADLVLFDPETVADRSTFEDPKALSVGIERVWVNGTEVWRDGRSTGAFPGRGILKP